jgi:hypothetical protein
MKIRLVAAELFHTNRTDMVMIKVAFRNFARKASGSSMSMIISCLYKLWALYKWFVNIH